MPYIATTMKGTEMSKPLTPPPMKAREAHFKQKIAHQQGQPLGSPPVPTDAPRIVPDPLKGKK